VKLAQQSRIKAEGLGIWIIVLAIVGGAVWFIYTSRTDGAKNGRAFADQVIQKVVVEYDEKYLDLHLSNPARAQYLPMWRTRMIQYLRGFGPLAKPPETKGNVYFTSQFFDPRGSFRSDLTYANTTAYLELTVSKGTRWQIDEINLVWNPPPAPTPTPSPAMTPSPTPSPTASPPPSRKRKR
jgi:hypothetical protein